VARKRVLVVDDDVKVAKVVQLYLSRDGYDVIMAYDGLQALRLARESRPDLIVLDLMLPEVDGLQVCRTIKSETDVPIIMLTAKTTEHDRITGLDLGADDYMPKPFSPKELAARVRAVLRRLPQEALERGPRVIDHGEIRIDFAKYKVSFGGKPLNLTPTEFRLLGTMARNPGEVFSRAELIDRVFRYDFEGFDRTIDTHILNLRRKLEPEPGNPRYIVTVFGAGYKFAGDDRDS
jgi:DNA-binding response OmpR family regulator